MFLLQINGLLYKLIICWVIVKLLLTIFMGNNYFMTCIDKYSLKKHVLKINNDGQQQAYGLFDNKY